MLKKFPGQRGSCRGEHDTVYYTRSPVHFLVGWLHSYPTVPLPGPGNTQLSGRLCYHGDLSNYWFVGLNFSPEGHAQKAQSGVVSVTAQKETDHQLVERVKRGDKRAYDLLVLKYQHKIVGLVSRYLRDQDEVMDVTQEAFIKAFRALPRFRGDSAFYTWLYRIAINTAKNHLVSKSRRPPDSDIDVDEGEFHDNTAVLKDIENPENALATDQLEAVVYKAIDDLPEELKAAVTLREFEGLSYEEIAEVMECPVGTVRSRIFRAREAIEKKIEAIG